MENKGYISSVRINDLVLTQFIDLSTDSVHFEHEDTNKDLFIIDHSGYCDYIEPNTGIISKIGKFGYSNSKCFLIKFDFNEDFLIKNPDIKDSSIETPTGDFIRAEKIVIEKLFKQYPVIFTLPNKNTQPC